MTKPHEETWTAKPENDADDPVWMVVAPDSTVMADTIEEPAAKLIAQAPAMARLLLKLQWVEWEHCSICPSCSGAAEGYGHKPDCELVSVLRAAGVLP